MNRTASISFLLGTSTTFSVAKKEETGKTFLMEKHALVWNCFFFILDELFARMSHSERNPNVTEKHLIMFNGCCLR